jgi:hypothetical protein
VFYAKQMTTNVPPLLARTAPHASTPSTPSLAFVYRAILELFVRQRSMNAPRIPVATEQRAQISSIPSTVLVQTSLLAAFVNTVCFSSSLFYFSLWFLCALLSPFTLLFHSGMSPRRLSGLGCLS